MEWNRMEPGLFLGNQLVVLFACSHLVVQNQTGSRNQNQYQKFRFETGPKSLSGSVREG